MVTQQFNEGEQWSGGIAYIACPNDIDRSVYINDCYRNHRVSIKMEDGSLVNRVPISIDILSFIDFPLKSDELGTAVAFLTDPKHQHPMIIARFEKSDQLGDGRERVFQIGRKFNEKLVSIVGDVDKGTLSINLNAGDREGRLIINVDNDNDDNTFEVEVAGNIELKATDGTFFHNHNQFKSTVSDSEEDQPKPSIISQTRQRTLVTNEQVVINAGDASIVHYKGYRIAIDDNGIQIDGLDKEVVIRSHNNKIALNSKGIDIEGESSVRINGGFEALYNKTPGVPITDVSQIGVSKKVKIG